jgi:5'(3')-deoxyribonucleotidase
MTVILSDVDGVCCDFVGGLCKELAHRGFVKTADDVKHWELAESFTPDELRASLEIMASPGFCHGLAWYDGARDFVHELEQLGDVHAVTAPFRNGTSWMHERLAWLSGVVAGDRVHFVSGKYKHMMRGDALIEDHPKNAHDWLEANPDGIAILIDRPWNSPAAKEFWPHLRMFRVRSFDEALQALKECA